MNSKRALRWLGMLAAGFLLTGCDGEATSATAAEQAGRVNVNTATVEQLETLPGIGEVTAQRIVESRPYKTPEDLLKVKGIGDATLNDVRGLIDL